MFSKLVLLIFLPFYFPLPPASSYFSFSPLLLLSVFRSDICFAFLSVLTLPVFLPYPNSFPPLFSSSFVSPSIFFLSSIPNSFFFLPFFTISTSPCYLSLPPSLGISIVLSFFFHPYVPSLLDLHTTPSFPPFILHILSSPSSPFWFRSPIICPFPSTFMRPFSLAVSPFPHPPFTVFLSHLFQLPFFIPPSVPSLSRP